MESLRRAAPHPSRQPQATHPERLFLPNLFDIRHNSICVLVYVAVWVEGGANIQHIQWPLLSSMPLVFPFSVHPPYIYTLDNCLSYDDTSVHKKHIPHHTGSQASELTQGMIR